MYRSVPQKCPPPFCNLSLSTKCRGGACMRDATFSLARLRPPFRCLAHKFMSRYIEDNAFDNFAVAIWMLFIHVAVPCRNRRLLHRVFQSHWSLNFRRLIRALEYLMIYETHASPALNGSSVIWRFKHSDVMEIGDGMTLDFYTGLPDIVVSNFW